MKVTQFACGPAANESERAAFAAISSRLQSTAGDDEWILLTNLPFSVTPQNQSDEIDIVAIGPPGVRVIEVKHWNPEWVKANQDRVADEAERAAHKARRVGTTLRRHVSDVGYVHAVILLTRRSPKGKASAGSPGPVRGVNIWTLKEWKEAVGIQPDAPAALQPQQVVRLGRVLAPQSSVAIDGSLRRLAGYVNLERRSSKEERFHRIYAGVHSVRRDRVVLHLYDASATDAASPEKLARREFDALYRMQRYDWAPRILDSFQGAPGYAGEMDFFTVVDPAVPSLEKRMRDKSWDTHGRLTFARSAIRAPGRPRSRHLSSCSVSRVRRRPAPPARYWTEKRDIATGVRGTCLLRPVPGHVPTGVAGSHHACIDLRRDALGESPQTDTYDGERMSQVRHLAGACVAGSEGLSRVPVFGDRELPRATVDRGGCEIKQMDRFKAYYFAEGQPRPASVLLRSMD